jgi:DNA-binding transcriptional regulator GbsR (MarR family)
MSKGLSWSVGKVQSALKRLEDDLVTEAVVERGRAKKLYSLKKVEDFLDFTKL